MSVPRQAVFPAAIAHFQYDESVDLSSRVRYLEQMIYLKLAVQE